MNDLINACFEFSGGGLLIINVVKIIQHKGIRGISWIPTFFFSLWGGWNLYYYPSLNQWFSFASGILVFVVNVTWIGLVFYYKRKYEI